MSITRWIADARTRREQLFAPAIMLPELASAVRRVTGHEEDAEEALDRFGEGSGISYVPASIELCNAAAEIAIRYSIKGCDAIYVALAQQLDEPLVTFDREQAERAAAVIRVIVPA